MVYHIVRRQKAALIDKLIPLTLVIVIAAYHKNFLSCLFQLLSAIEDIRCNCNVCSDITVIWFRIWLFIYRTMVILIMAGFIINLKFYHIFYLNPSYQNNSSDRHTRYLQLCNIRKCNTTWHFYLCSTNPLPISYKIPTKHKVYLWWKLVRLQTMYCWFWKDIILSVSFIHHPCGIVHCSLTVLATLSKQFLVLL